MNLQSGCPFIGEIEMGQKQTIFRLDGIQLASLRNAHFYVQDYSKYEHEVPE